ncbi:MAG: TIGR02391 family protein [Chloroflexi bacterium]|nr:TIGR02391 family protein [Chloroflexota bacterium]
MYDAIVTHEGLRGSTRSLFVDAYYPQCVFEAYKLVNNRVKDRSGLHHCDGADLMRTAFSSKKPIVALNAGVSQTEKNQQLGYMHIFEGCMEGVRNPRGHETCIADTVGTTLELLALANHLLCIVEEATVAASTPQQ